ncbi:hypothetical protein GCM10027020_02060 [Nocardioides salsibiostraticola]
MSPEEYDLRWRALVTKWGQLVERRDGSALALLRRAREAGLAEVPDLDEFIAHNAGRGPEVHQGESFKCEVALIRGSGAVDGPAYLEANSAAMRGDDPIKHFAHRGWRTLRNPSLSFDVWWYWSEYLDPAVEGPNPLVHYLLEGQYVGHDPLPTRPERPVPSALGAGPVRRACLFAGYDPDGLIDDVVVAYVRELSRFADVYYLADCALQNGELEKLGGLAAGAWSERHGTYDFGSYSRLARDYVGWDVLETYDEVLFVNDSCYLLRPLDDVFAAMNERRCDWWGLQVTARYFDGTGEQREPLPIDHVKREMLPRAVMEGNGFVHIGSYFLAVRRPIITDAGFRKRLEAVAAQPSKIMIIYKYETGTSQYLIGQGYEFDTYAADLHPYHPIYGPAAFDLIADGFPLLKRAFLADNPYDTPDLESWKERVAELVPQAPVEQMEANLWRVSPDDRIRRSFAIHTRADGGVEVPTLLNDEEFADQDATTPTYDEWWAFPVCGYEHTLAGNERALFEEVRDDPAIKKIILTRSRAVEVDGVNTVAVPLHSPEGQYHLLRSGQVFLKHGVHKNVEFPVDPERHNLINLWHGIPLKRFGPATFDASQNPEFVRAENAQCRAVITSSAIDTLAMTAAFHPLTLHDMWPTGLPRNDFIVREDALLPPDLSQQEADLRAEVGDRRLVMFLPTFKSGQAEAYYEFSSTELDWLAGWAERNNAVLGIREHMADKAHTYSRMLAPLKPIDLSARRFPTLEILYRVADALVTDYSSCVVDFLLTGRPVISFAYDYERYVTEERGLFYDLEEVLPGPVARDFEALGVALDDLFRERTTEETETYAWRRRIFFDHLDDGASRRVSERVRALYAQPSAPDASPEGPR